MASFRQNLGEFFGGLILLPFAIARHRRRNPPLPPYIDQPPPNLNSPITANRVPLSRVPSLNDLTIVDHTASPPQASLDTLPLEIRQIIWENVLGAHTIHLEWQLDHPDMHIEHNRHPETRNIHLVGYQCLASDPSICRRFHGGCHPSWRSRYTRKPAVTGLLALLMVCKQIYRESIEILYASNTFVMSDDYDHMSLGMLPYTLIPHRLNSIRSLRLHWDLYNEPPLPPPPEYIGDFYQDQYNHHMKWTKLWHILAEMQGLENLEVELIVAAEWDTLNKESAEILLAPIKLVARSKNLILSLPFPAMTEGMARIARYVSSARNGWEGSDPWDDLDCTIRRVQRGPY